MNVSIPTKNRVRGVVRAAVVAVAAVGTLVSPPGRASGLDEIGVVQSVSGVVGTWGPVLGEDGQGQWVEHDVRGIPVGDDTFPQASASVMSASAIVAQAQYWEDVVQAFTEDNGVAPLELDLTAYATSAGCQNFDGSEGVPPQLPPSISRVLVPPSALGDEADLPLCESLVIVATALPAATIATVVGAEANSVLLGPGGVVVAMAMGDNYFALESGMATLVETGDDGINAQIEAACMGPSDVPPEEQLPADYWFERCEPSYISHLNQPIEGARIYAAEAGGVNGTYTFTNANGHYQLPLTFIGAESAYNAAVGAEQGYTVVTGTGWDHYYERFSRFGTEQTVLNAYINNTSYRVRAELRYDAFNPNDPAPGYFTVTSGEYSAFDHSASDSAFFNVAVDTATVTFQARFMRGPEQAYELVNEGLAASIGDANVTGSQTLGNVPVLTGDFSLYEVNPLQRNDSLYNQGLLTHIGRADLTKTDVYIFNEATGQLVGTRQGILGINEIPGEDDEGDAAVITATTIVRGPNNVADDLSGNNNSTTTGPGLWDWDYVETEDGALGIGVVPTNTVVREAVGPTITGLRMYDGVQVVVINRATGYMGSVRGQVKPGPSGMPVIAHAGTDAQMLDVPMRPPNLKVSVERREDPAGGDGPSLIGADGAGLTSDFALVVRTEWFAEDGAPLPEELPGFTGRFSRVTDGQLVPDTSGTDPDNIGEFAVAPGKHTVVLKLPQEEIDREHFYIHVSGVPPADVINFANGVMGDDSALGADKWSTQEVFYESFTEEGGELDTEWTGVEVDPEVSAGLVSRPVSFVPFQVVRFDKDTTALAAAAQMQALGDAYEDGDEIPILEDMPVVYRWLYSPEMHFSLYDLDVQSVEVTTGGDGGDPNDPASTNVEVTYDLSGADDANLPGLGGGPGDSQDDGIVWGVGFEQIDAMHGDDSVVEGEDIDDQLDDTATGDNDPVEELTEEDLISLSLFVVGDEANSLWDIDGLMLMLVNPRELNFQVYERATPDGTGPDIQHKSEFLRFVLTRKAAVRVGIRSSDPALQDNVHWLWGSWSVKRDLGEYFAVVTTQDVLDAGFLPGHADAGDGDLGFEVIIQAKPDSDDPSQQDENELLTHTAIFPATLEEIHETESLVDGSLNLQRVDLSIPSLGPNLEVVRRYSNLPGASSASAMGIGWTHNFEDTVLGIQLDDDGGALTPNWVAELRSRALFPRDEFSQFLPTRWKEVAVRGVRFHRNGDAWEPERGSAGRLEDIVDPDDPEGLRQQYLFTDAAGTAYRYERPSLPVPPDLLAITDDDPNTEEDESGQPEGPTIHIGDSLLYRIQMPPMHVEPPDTAPPSPAEQRIGDPLAGHVVEVVAKNGQRLSFEYDPVHYNDVLRVVDSYGRALEYTYEDCLTEGECRTRSAAPRRLAQVTLDTTELQKTVLFHYDVDGYLQRATYAGNEETYGYAPQFPDSESFVYNLAQTTIDAADGTPATTQYAYFPSDPLEELEPCRPDGEATDFPLDVELSDVTILRHEVVSRTTYPEAAGEDGEADDGVPIVCFGYRVLPTGQLERIVSDPRGQASRYVLNEHGNIVEYHEPLGRVTHYTWKIDVEPADAPVPSNEIVAMVEELGDAGTRSYTYDYDFSEWGYVTRKSVEGPTEAGEIVDTTMFDPEVGLPTEHTDRYGVTESWTYGPDGSMATYVDGQAETWTWENTYGADGTLDRRSMFRQGSEQALSTKFYGESGYVDSEVEHVQCEAGAENPCESRDEAVLRGFNSMGRMLWQRTPEGDTTEMTVDDHGSVISVLHPALDSCPPGLPGELQLRCSGQASSSAVFDAYGRKHSETDTEGLTLLYTYDARGRVRTITRSTDSASRQFHYDNNGNVVSETDWSGRVTRHTYDDLDRRVSTTGRHGAERTTTFDLGDHVLASTDFAGVPTHRVYDALDRLEETCVGAPCEGVALEGAAHQRIEYLDDVTSGDRVYGVRVTSIRGRGQPDGTQTEYFDAMDRVIESVGADGRSTNTEYNVFGGVFRLTDPDGLVTTFSGDSRGRPWRRVEAGHDGTSEVERVQTYQYNRNGRILERAGPAVSSVSGEPLAVTHEFDSWGRIVRTHRETEDEGELKAFAHDRVLDAQGRTVWTRGPNGTSVATTRDALGRVVAETDPSGTWTQAFDANGNKIRMTDVSGRNTCWAYDDADRMTDSYVGAEPDCTSPSLVPGGVHTQFSDIRGDGFVQTVVDGYGRTWARDTDPNGNTASTTLVGSGGASVSEYTGDGLLVRSVDPEGATWEMNYDAVGRLVERIAPDGLSELLDHATAQEVSRTTRNGTVQRLQFNAFGQEFAVEEGGTTVTTRRFDGAGRVVAETDALGNEGLWSYYDRGAVRSMTMPDVAAGTPEVEYGYDLQGNVTRVTNPAGIETHAAFDGLGRKLTETRYAGTDSAETISYTYTPRGLVDTMTLPDAQPGERHDGQHTSFTYDLHGRLETVNEPYVDSGAEVVGPGEDDAGGGWLTTRYVYNLLGAVTEVHGTHALEQEYTYDALGRLTQHVRHGDVLMTTAYDDFDNNGVSHSMTSPQGLASTSTFDAMGRLVGSTFETPAEYPDDVPWATSKSWTYVADELHAESVTKSWPSGHSTTDAKTYTYAGPRRRLDTLTQVHQWVDAGSVQSRQLGVSVAHDLVGRVACIGTGAGACTEGEDPLSDASTFYDYDALGQLSAVRAGADETTYAYLLDGRMSSASFGNGTLASYTYDPTSGRLHQLVHTKPGDITSASYEYEYYKGGRRSAEVRNVEGDNRSFAYDYDSIGRLTLVSETVGAAAATTTRYGYGDGYDRKTEVVEQAGNTVRSATLAYNAAHQIRTVSDSVGGQVTRYEHDNSGNLVSRRVDGDPSQDTRFWYDGLDQLVEVTRGAPGAESVLGRYDYDVAGARIREWHASSGTQTGPPIGRGRFYFGGRVLEEYGWDVDAGMDTSRFRWAGGQLLSKDTAGERAYVHADAIGSTAAVTDSDGETAGTWSTSAWGETTAGAGNTAGAGELRHSFTGHVADAATGLVYMRARYYDPEIGQFLTEDLVPGRLEDPRSQHRYMYAHGDPVGNVDPTGLETVFIGQHQSGVFSDLGVTVEAFEKNPSFFRPDPNQEYLDRLFEMQSSKLGPATDPYGGGMDPFLASEDVHAVVGDIVLVAGVVAELSPVGTALTFWKLATRGPDALDEWEKLEVAATVAGLAAGGVGAIVGNVAAKAAKLAKLGARAVKGIKKGARGGERGAAFLAKLTRGRRGASAASRGRRGTRAADRGKDGLDGLKHAPPSAAPKATGHPSANNPNPQRVPAPSGPARAGNSKSAGGGNRKGPKAPEKPRDTTAQPERAGAPNQAAPNPKCTVGCFAGGTVVLTPEGELAIDEVELGSRVLVEADGLSCETEVDEAWVVVELEVELDDGGKLQMETLKPPSWLEENGAEEGSLVWVELEELGVAGEARVKNIRGSPAVAEGAGCVVLSRYQRVRSWVLDVELSSGERVEVTDNHLLYSESRDGWVQAGRLAVGEYVRGAYATLLVDGVEARPGAVEVFNLEVEGQHRYLVGRDGIVAHNAGTGGCPWARNRAQQLLDSSEGVAGPGSNIGHARAHVPRAGQDPRALAQSRPTKQNTTVYRNERHATQDLREALQANADDILALTPGSNVGFRYRPTAPRPGYNSQLGGPASEVSIREVTGRVAMMPDGRLHLVHFAPAL